MTAPQTFPALLDQRRRAGADQPLITWYDDASGERVELSTTTYANWVAKTAHLLIEEYDLEAGDVVCVDLPAHWLVPVFLGAAWCTGVAVTTDRADRHDLLVTGTAAATAGPSPVLASALLPFAVRSPDPLPPGVDDYGVLVPGQPDAFPAVVPPVPQSPAWAGATPLTQGELLAAAPAAASGARVLTDLHPAAQQAGPAFLGPLLAGGSLVLVGHPDPGRWEQRRRDERADVTLRA